MVMSASPCRSLCRSTPRAAERAQHPRIPRTTHHVRLCHHRRRPMTDPRRQLPSIDTLLAGPGVAALLSDHPRALVVKAARLAVEAARASGGAMPPEGWDAAVRAAALRLAEPSLAPVINATGVVLHTNLGRAPLAEAAIASMTRVARGYAALEYDLGGGTGGRGHVHSRGPLGV